MIDQRNDLDFPEECWGYLFQALKDRCELLGPIGDVYQIPTQTEAGLIVFAIESFGMSCEDEDTRKAAFLHLVELTWEAWARQKLEPPEERERRMQNYKRWIGEQDAKLRALLAADVEVRGEDLPPHPPSAARVAADASGDGAELAQSAATPIPAGRR